MSAGTDTILPVEHVGTVIVGAGFAGLGMGIRLARRGERSFVILERAEQVGGTWRDNRYPGVACDIPAQLYSYSFRPSAEWSASFAPGAEIQQYLRTAAAEEGLAAHLRFGTELQDAAWDADAARWRLLTSGGRLTADVLVLACGRLTEPRIPDVPGLADFRGDVFHSARWRDDVPLAERRVAVVGSGASAVQLVPHVAAVADHLVVLQRSAPYLVPRGTRPVSAAERALLRRDPEEAPRRRADQFWRLEEGFASRTGDATGRAAAREVALGHLRAQVADPSLRTRLTPEYEIGCKRVLLSDDYYPALQSPSVTLVPSAIAAVDATAVTAADGSRHEVDVIVLATGFRAAHQPYARFVRGIDGVSLAEHWRDGMTSFASTTVAGFPNLFVLDGPNGGLGHNSAVFMIETQIEYVLAALAHRAAVGSPVLSLRPDAEAAYTAALDSSAAATVWTTGGCTSWYLEPGNGRLTLLWPDFAHTFRDRFGDFDPEPYEAARSPWPAPVAVR
ncbi:flavin-containing monooxygenase [uncultured Amnibacterium sp.]|uniref:flavin-containing monooxygenase n=1 Tax=uncultured Amnibacterium sp. TaxID=1631851 RepID=UPI0035CB2848